MHAYEYNVRTGLIVRVMCGVESEWILLCLRFASAYNSNFLYNHKLNGTHIIYEWGLYLHNMVILYVWAALTVCVVIVCYILAAICSPTMTFAWIRQQTSRFQMILTKAGYAYCGAPNQAEKTVSVSC